MDVKKIDVNFIDKVSDDENLDEYVVPNKNFDLYGMFYEEEAGKFMRVPQKLSHEVGRGMTILAPMTSGGRVRFSTDSDVLEIKVHYTDICHLKHMPLLSSGGFVLTEDFEDDHREFMQIYIPEFSTVDDFRLSKALRKDGKMHYYTLFFPIYAAMSFCSLGVKKGSKVSHGLKYRDVKPIIYYGGSTTMACCVSRQDNAFQATISKWNNIDFYNLGFSGNAYGEQSMAEYVASFDVSLFVCYYDYNSSIEQLNERHLEFYKTYRRFRPNVPILFISKQDYDVDVEGSEKRIKIIKKTLKYAKEHGDNNVYFIPGKSLWGKKDREICSVDSCHSNDLGEYRMAEHIYKKMIKIDKIFK